MKFTEMPYSRPDMAGMKQGYEALTERLKGAKTYTEARDAFLQKEVLESGISTQESLASVRHSIDTRDEFYDGEARFWNAAMPELEVDIQEWTKALLASPFRAEFEKEFGSRMFLREEMALKTFSPEIIPDMQQENDQVREYEKLLASAPTRCPSWRRLRRRRMMRDVLRRGRRKENGTGSTRTGWTTSMTVWSICGTAWGRSWAMRAIRRLATTAWAATAIRRMMWRNSATRCGAM